MHVFLVAWFLGLHLESSLDLGYSNLGRVSVKTSVGAHFERFSKFDFRRRFCISFERERKMVLVVFGGFIHLISTGCHLGVGDVGPSTLA